MKQLLKEKINNSFLAGTFIGLILGIFGFFISLLSDDSSFKNGAFFGYLIISFIIYTAVGIGLIFIIKSVS